MKLDRGSSARPSRPKCGPRPGDVAALVAEVRRLRRSPAAGGEAKEGARRRRRFAPGAGGPGRQQVAGGGGGRGGPVPRLPLSRGPKAMGGPDRSAAALAAGGARAAARTPRRSSARSSRCRWPPPTATWTPSGPRGARRPRPRRRSERTVWRKHSRPPSAVEGWRGRGTARDEARALISSSLHRRCSRVSRLKTSSTRSWTCFHTGRIEHSDRCVHMRRAPPWRWQKLPS
jgi:hypothetical protein